MSNTNSNTLSILLIEDNTADVHLIQNVLQSTNLNRYHQKIQYAFTIVNNLKDALQKVTESTIDIILLDLSLPDSEKLNTFYKVHNGFPQTPIIILSGLDDESLAIDAMKHGAQDYLLKDNILIEGILNRSIKYAIERHRLWLELEEKKKVLEKLENNRRQIIEQNADGIIILDRQGVVQFVNPAAEDILRNDKTKLLNKPFHIPKLQDGTAQLNVERRRGGEASIELRLVETEWNGKQAYQASVRDISELKEVQQQIEEKAQMLAVQNVELDEFAHTMAHQVQGLLSQMVGYASFIEMNHQELLPEDAVYSLNRIVQSGNKMNNVINELLLLASMRSNEVPLTPLNMNRIIGEVMKRLRFQIEENNVSIDLSSDWPIPVGHAPWIEEAILNYVTNGIKYGGDPPKIVIGAEKRSDGFIQVWVKDNGEGISENDQKRLFKAHTRLRKVRARGEGLGLSIVKRIIHNCGGKVGVTSEEGNGSKFWFTLPEATSADMNNSYDLNHQPEQVIPAS